MTHYEIVFLARQDITTSQVEALVTSFSEIIGNGGGKVANYEYCGLKSLTYRIRKNRKAHYGLMDITAPATAVKELERLMRINEDVLRFLTVKVEDFGPRPSALSQSRYSRDDRNFNRDDSTDTEVSDLADAEPTA
ncbi:MAG: 30S ribosomal protein S6 [Alphaproteobacteria bacterium]|nr:30S ribosomal protein S6 [Alphaproteobacteria bacterium]OJV46477.1 MAG: 30S ribosomal protein S6 [Alphaproteobacteria bacterium 43-37]